MVKVKIRANAPEVTETILTTAGLPPLLAESPAPPHLLYVSGNAATLFLPSIAVVGSRAMTPYGEQACRYVVTACVRAGFAIVSGLATGIDAIAHQTTLELGGSTVAVLGSGLDPAVIFPAGNRHLAEKIIEQGGALVSEYPATAVARRHHFLERNRILAGLSVATIVVEAAYQSGAINTAHHAIEANRSVFAVPGSIFSTRSSGTHRLLKEGAQVLHSIDDLFSDLALPIRSQQSGVLANLSPMQQGIMQRLHEGTCDAEALAQTLSCSSAELQASLTELEIQGIVRKNIWMHYEINP